MREFSKQERAKLMDINSRLHGLEKRILDVVIKTERSLTSLQNCNEVDDYNIYLDTLYQDKDDSNKKVAFYRDYYSISKEILDKDDAIKYLCAKNQNEFQHQDYHPMKNEWHCQFYNCLYGEIGLSFEEILDIGKVDALLGTDIYYNPKILHLKKFNNDIDYFINNETAEIMKINSALQDVQKTLISKAILYENELKQKLEDGIIKGFDMNYEVVFCTNEEDSKRNDIVAIIKEPLNMSEEMKLPTFQNRWMRKYSGSNYCYLFNALRNHTNLRSHTSKLYSIGEIILSISLNEYFEA